MSDIKSRLKQLANSKGFSIRGFEEFCGLTRGNISNILPGGAIGSDKLAKILDAIPDINLAWLISGIGEMFATPDTADKRCPADMSEFFYNKTLEQAAQLGQLREQLAQAQREIEAYKTGKNEPIRHHAPTPIKIAP